MRKCEFLLKIIVQVSVAMICFGTAFFVVAPGGFIISSLWNEFCGIALMLIALAEV